MGRVHAVSGSEALRPSNTERFQGASDALTSEWQTNLNRGFQLLVRDSRAFGALSCRTHTYDLLWKNADSHVLPEGYTLEPISIMNASMQKIQWLLDQRWSPNVKIPSAWIPDPSGEYLYIASFIQLDTTRNLAHPRSPLSLMRALFRH